MKFLLCGVCLLLASISTPVAADSFDIWQDGYEVFSGDIDGDGVDDLYFSYHPQILFVYSEISTPVKLDRLPNFVLYGSLTDSGHSYNSPVEATLSEDIVDLLRQNSTDHSLSGDFNGDGEPDLLLLSSTPVLLHGSSNSLPTLAQTFSVGSNTTELTVILSKADPNLITIQDVNGDGKEDIVISGAEETTILAGASGTFDDFNTPIIDSETSIAGSSAGQFQVSEMGAATYSLPILSPPGTAGVAPVLSLDYISNGGDGLVGVGWSVGGQSSVTRCRQVLSIDTNLAPIKWNESDRFCLLARFFRLTCPNVFQNCVSNLVLGKGFDALR